MGIIKLVIIGLLLLHAMIHLLGFATAYEIVDASILIREVTPFAGVLWLLEGLLLLSILTLHDFGIRIWPLIGILALILSQTLIVAYWSDAHYGTFANLVLLIWLLPSVGDYRFNKNIENEKQHVLMSDLPQPEVVTSDQLQHLPEVVKKWLNRSGVVNNAMISTVSLLQEGKMRLSAEHDWMPFMAQQHFNTIAHSFLWTSKLQMMPLLYLTGMDKLYHGQGQMNIKLLSLIDVVNEAPNDKINTATMIRYLAEMCWFPTAALSKEISWSELDRHTARAKLTIDDTSVSGIFRFNDEGDIASFEAMRYRDGGPDATPMRWVVTNTSYRQFEGWYLPNKCEVSWVNNDEPFNWLTLEVTDWSPNQMPHNWIVTDRFKVY